MRITRRRLHIVVLLGAMVALLAVPAVGLSEPAGPSRTLLNHLSSGVQLRYYLAHPEQAPAALASRLQAVRQQAVAAADPRAPFGDLFNKDDIGLPQNEESVTVCKNNPRFVMEGANDYRGLLDRYVDFSGWYFSDDGGRTVKKEGLLPPIHLNGVNGQLTGSGGDPALQSDDNCNIFYADLNYNSSSEGFNGIGLYKTNPKVLETCRGGQDPDSLTTFECWPTRKVVAFTNAVAPGGAPGHFLDKEWMDVGRSGKAGEVVWVVYSDFNNNPNPPNPAGFSAQIKAVRCDANLNHCTSPILISGNAKDIQFGDVTIAQDGRVLITWADIAGELEGTAQTFTVKARIAPAGSTTFGPTHVVSRETNPLPFGGVLHANDFRIATNPKSIMPRVNGKDVPYVTWDRCRFRLLDTICEEAEIVMSRSLDNGVTWSKPKTISVGGDNYFPAISDEVGNPNFEVAYYTNRFDPVFHNRQDVETATIAAASGNVVKRTRVTEISNETEADPLLGGAFIGDYIDVHLLKGTAYVAYNANVRHVRVLGQGFPVPQQDNFLTKVPG